MTLNNKILLYASNKIIYSQVNCNFFGNASNVSKQSWVVAETCNRSYGCYALHLTFPTLSITFSQRNECEHEVV